MSHPSPPSPPSPSSPPSPLRIGYVPEHYLLPLHLTTFPLPTTLIPFPSGTGAMITALRAHDLDLAIGLTEGWVAGLLSPEGQQLKQTEQGRGYQIVGRWVQSPLCWAVVTGRERADVRSLTDLGQKGKGEDPGGGQRRVGVSRLGSGSHVMAFVLAQREGWIAPPASSSSSSPSPSTEAAPLTIMPLGPLPALITAVTGTADEPPAADFFMWEHFTTKPHFHSPSPSPSTSPPPLKHLSSLLSPWPSWHIAASTLTFPSPSTSQLLTRIFAALDHGIRHFKADPELAVRMLGTGEVGCRYADADAREWVGGVEFVESTRGVDGRVLGGVVEALRRVGVVDQGVGWAMGIGREEGDGDGDGVVGMEME